MSDREDDAQPKRDIEATLKDKATSIAEAAAGIAEKQKAAGAEQLSGIAGAVHAAADELEQRVPGVSGYIHDAAGRIDKAATGLRERSISELADGMRQLGRDQPLALFGGAVLAGFALSRFFKSANGASAGTSEQTDTGQSNRWQEDNHGERL